MFSGPGDDFAAGGRGNDNLWGGQDRDQLQDGPGTDALYGGGGRDSLMLMAGGDYASSGGGDDTITVLDEGTTPEYDEIRCGAGFDRVTFYTHQDPQDDLFFCDAVTVISPST